MTELKNDRYLRALLRQPVDVTPVWMMRQAGRYLPEYKATRAQAGDFMSLCKNAELACEVTLQPLRRYKLDAAILFSDILTIPDAMGLGLYFEAGEGPRFTSPITCRADVEKLPVPDPEQELGYVMNAVRTIRRELKGEVPLIGFSGSPWTLATYMVEGGSSKAFTVIKKMMYAEPQTLHLLLDKLANSVTLYLNAQIKAGAGQPHEALCLAGLDHRCDQQIGAQQHVVVFFQAARVFGEVVVGRPDDGLVGAVVTPHQVVEVGHEPVAQAYQRAHLGRGLGVHPGFVDGFVVVPRMDAEAR